MTLEDPSNFYALLSQKDLEDDVMVVAPIVNLQPNGCSFKKPVRVTLGTMLDIKYFKGENVVILHGTGKGMERSSGRILLKTLKLTRQVER